MADINTNTSSSKVNDKTKKKELKIEQRNEKYAEKLAENKVKQIAQQEKKKARLTIKLNKITNPKRKNRIQDKIDAVDQKIKDLNDPTKTKIRRPFGLVMRTWSKGLNKETGRITWHKKGGVLKDFIIIVLVCIFFVIIFFALDMIILAMKNH